jgi:hypothetical protein
MAGIEEAKEYFKRLKQAETHCGGDVELAKKLLAGDYRDAIVFKGRFKDMDDEIYGLFIVIVSRVFSSIIETRSIISQLASIYRHRPIEHWHTFISRLEKEKEEAEFDPVLSDQINNALKRFLEVEGVSLLIFLAEGNDIAHLTDQFRNIIQSILKKQDIQIVVDFEQASSMDIHEKTGLSPA